MDLGPWDVVALDRAREMLGTDAEGVDEIPVTSGDELHVPGAVDLLDVELDDDLRRIGKRGEVGQELECEPRVHDVQQGDAASDDEIEQRLGHGRSVDQVGKRPNLLRIRLDLRETAVL